MNINILLPYEESAKYYAKWAHEEKKIDFCKDIDRAERCTVSFAAEELCEYLKKAGLNVKVVDEYGEFNIILKSAEGSGEEFEISTEGNNLILCGASRIGVLYAVYELLEAQGIRWYSPYEEYVPELEKLTIPQCKKYRYDMPDGRGFHFEGVLKESEPFILWMARNRLNMHRCHPHCKKMQQKLGFKLHIGGHIFEDILHPLNIAEQGGYFIDVHKDWYGKRAEAITAENARSVQFCVSNEELLDYLAEAVIEKANTEWQDEEYFDLSGFDTWGGSCQCEGCQKLGNGSDRTLYFLSHIRKRINEAYDGGRINRQIYLGFYAYEGTDTMEAPLHPVPQNLIDAGDVARFCPILRCYDHDLKDVSCDKNVLYERTLHEWLQTGMKITMNEYYNVSKFEDLPLLFTKRMQNEIPCYIQSGVTGIGYMHVPMVEWGVGTINQYLYANISRDRYCDAKKLIQKYFADLYGKYADAARKIYEQTEEATRYCSSFRGWMYGNLLAHLLKWDGSMPEKPFYRESHLGGEAITKGYEIVSVLEDSYERLKDIKHRELLCLTSDMFDTGKAAVNPIEQRKKMAGPKMINRVNEDIRGIRYGLDVFKFMVLCLDYYCALYEKREDARALYESIVSLGDRMSEYTYGIKYSNYNPEMYLETALKRSQLNVLYYKIIANRHLIKS